MLIIATLSNIAALLRTVVFISEPPLGGPLDFKRVGLRAVAAVRVLRVSLVADARPKALSHNMSRSNSYDIVLGNRVTVGVTEELRDALGRAAEAQDLTTSDFIREAISDRLDRVGTPHTRIPPLRRRPT